MSVSTPCASWFPLNPSILPLYFYIQYFTTYSIFNSIIRTNTVMNNGFIRMIYVRFNVWRKRIIDINIFQFFWFFTNTKISPLKIILKNSIKIFFSMTCIFTRIILPRLTYAKFIFPHNYFLLIKPFRIEKRFY